MSRLHPFTFVFSELADTRFPAIRAEAPEPALDLPTMARLQATQTLLQELGSPELAEAHPDAVTEYLALLFVAFRYWEAGQPTLAIAKHALADKMANPPADPRAVPDGACYLAFPERWVWATIGEDQPHEPMDGLFVVSSHAGTELTIVAVLGLRQEREGFSQITVSARAEDVVAAVAAMRNPPFSAVMDGGREAGFRSVTSEGELLLLAHLALDSATE